MSETTSNLQRLTHKPLLTSDELVRLIEDNVEDFAIAVLWTDGRIINWSRGAETMFGYTVEEVLGQEGSLIFTPEDRDRGIPGQELAHAREHGRAADERYHLRKDGSRFWASGAMTALRERDGSLRGYVKIMRDMTDRKELEDSLRVERERCETAAREVDKVNVVLRRAMTEAHHRIKNNFQMLTSLIEVQMKDGEEPSAREGYRKLQMHVRSLAAIHDLLTEEVKTGEDFAFINAGSLLEKLVLLLLRTTEGRAINADIGNLFLPLERGTSLALIVSELIGNAVEHAAGDIDVKLTVSHGTARLSVSDHGPGFAPDFDPKRAAHTGLDLIESLARHDLSGEAHYENRPQGGARVTIIFPAQTSIT